MEKSKKIINLFYPNYKDVGYFFKKYLDKYVTKDALLLDIGCGRQSFGDEYYKKAKYKVGVDPDEEALKDNKLMDKKVCSDIENIPQSLGKFDVIIAQWVLEHIQNPKEDMKKIGSLCNKDGHFIFMTTNIYSPVTLISKVLSTGIKKKLRRKLFNIDEEDTYPTVYKINSASKIDYFLKEAGFEKVDIKKVGVLTYFSWNDFVLVGKIFFDKTIGRLNILPKTHIVGVYKKI
jgi:2-polyprenyl-3-methyl-5-hydroxy-6-metoxy-1,4-benzoquinol methylase